MKRIRLSRGRMVILLCVVALLSANGVRASLGASRELPIDVRLGLLQWCINLGLEAGAASNKEQEESLRISYIRCILAIESLSVDVKSGKIKLTPKGSMLVSHLEKLVPSNLLVRRAAQERDDLLDAHIAAVSNIYIIERLDAMHSLLSNSKDGSSNSSHLLLGVEETKEID